MCLRRTPNSDRGTSAHDHDDGGHGYDRGGHDRGHSHGRDVHDVRDHYHDHDHDLQKTLLLGTTRQQLSRKPEQTCEASQVLHFADVTLDAPRQTDRWRK